MPESTPRRLQQIYTPEAQKPLPPGDFENFCKGVKELLGVDLSLYKRKQMERRARGLASRNHAETLTAYLHMLQRDAVLLVYAEELSHAAVAAIMGCKEATVSWHVFEAKRALKGLL